jgi:predicted nucleic acid-binding protein
VSRAVLDASAAVHLVMNGDHAPRLAAKLEEVAVVAAPTLFCSEVANALWKYVHAGKLSLDLASHRVEECIGLADSLAPERGLVQEALVAAARYECSVYDMMYAVLARRSGAAVITMDRRLALKLGEMEIASYCPAVAA